MERIETQKLSLLVAPELGGRIESLIDRETGKEWIWHPDGYQPHARTLPIGASFDDHWTGGWDEVFPNDVACRFLSRDLPDHGELWSQKWDLVERDALGVELRYRCLSVPVSVSKRITVSRDSAKLTVRYRLANQSEERLPFLFKLHPALNVEPGDELLLPSCRIEPVDLGFSRLIGRAEKTHFPYGHDAHGDLLAVNVAAPRGQGAREFFYASELEGGWCGVRSEGTRTSLVFSFDRAVFPFVWMFASYGGWRDHYVVIPEPCTNVPYDLDTALRARTCAKLEPRETREWEVAVEIRR